MDDTPRQSPADQAVELRGETTLADLVEALRLRSRWNSDAWWKPLLGTSAVVVCLAVVLPSGLRPVAWMLLAPLVGTLLGSLYDRMRLRRRAGMLLRWDESQRPYTIRMDDEGIHTRTPVSTATHHWHGFRDCRETPGLFVLSLDDTVGGMCVLPKRAVRDAADVDRIRELAGRHLTR
ncbi:YcxB family protein [Streptomyces sp. TRM70350]|uniref:YcxB family protein n=1 Tax=Streptomyces sp. TRM70350 TaxID=2856165 RepID=UPI001C44AB5C|nr:YcxB family protein [Streptomyces sp. TRM70350]MBV7697033.1 YcxB family protein [Streptomyces sp. TRM70350]